MPILRSPDLDRTELTLFGESKAIDSEPGFDGASSRVVPRMR
jgi:hypothetical protein